MFPTSRIFPAIILCTAYYFFSAGCLHFHYKAVATEQTLFCNAFDVVLLALALQHALNPSLSFHYATLIVSLPFLPALTN